MLLIQPFRLSTHYLPILQVSYGKGQSAVVTSDLIKGQLKVREQPLILDSWGTILLGSRQIFLSASLNGLGGVVGVCTIC